MQFGWLCDPLNAIVDDFIKLKPYNRSEIQWPDDCLMSPGERFASASVIDFCGQDKVYTELWSVRYVSHLCSIATCSPVVVVCPQTSVCGQNRSVLDV